MQITETSHPIDVLMDVYQALPDVEELEEQYGGSEELQQYKRDLKAIRKLCEKLFELVHFQPGVSHSNVGGGK